MSQYIFEHAIAGVIAIIFVSMFFAYCIYKIVRSLNDRLSDEPKELIEHECDCMYCRPYYLDLFGQSRAREQREKMEFRARQVRNHGNDQDC